MCTNTAMILEGGCRDDEKSLVQFPVATNVTTVFEQDTELYLLVSQ